MHIEDAHDSALVDDIAVDIQPELPAEVSYRRARDVEPAVHVLMEESAKHRLWLSRRMRAAGWRRLTACFTPSR